MNTTDSTFESARQTAGHVKCPSCGGELVFVPEDGKLSCPYCGTKKDIAPAEGVVEEKDYYADRPEPGWNEGTILIHCGNCGANLLVDQTISARDCAFCGSPTLVDSGAAEVAAPEAVLPFKVSQSQALQSFKTWIKGRFFSPGDLKHKNVTQRLKGVYIPHFTYDCDTVSDYTAEAGTYYYVTETVTVMRDGKRVTETRQVRHTRWRRVGGTYADSYNDVLVNASKNVTEKLINMDFDLSALVPYKKEYLLGFLAENNSITKEDCWAAAQELITGDLHRKIINQIHADEVRGLSFKTLYSNVKFKKILLPVWSSVYTYKGRAYRFMINGQSGQVKGDAPLSALRIILSILLTVGVPLALFLLVNRIAGIVVFVAAVLTLIILATRKPK